LTESFEEGLRNIDVFLQTLVRKILESDSDTCSEESKIEPIQDILRGKYIRKCTIGNCAESDALTEYMIPLPHAEERLVDVFEDDKYVKVLMENRCKNQEVEIHTHFDVLEICTEECVKLNMPTAHLQMENMIVTCNNETLEIRIPKIRTEIDYK